MTNEQMNREMLYHASLSPFKKLAADGVIAQADFARADALLQQKYSPLFTERNIAHPLDNKPEQS